MASCLVTRHLSQIRSCKIIDTRLMPANHQVRRSLIPLLSRANETTRALEKTPLQGTISRLHCCQIRLTQDELAGALPGPAGHGRRAHACSVT